MEKKIKLVFCLLILSLASHSYAEQKNINLNPGDSIFEEAIKLCATVEGVDNSDWCKSKVYEATFFQREALDICKSNGKNFLDVCIEQIADRRYEGIYLTALMTCSKYQGVNLASRYYSYREYSYSNIEYIKEYQRPPAGCIPNLNASLPKNPTEGKSYLLPLNTQLLIPVPFTIIAGKNCAKIEFPEKKQLTCVACAHLTNEEMKVDNRFTLGIFETKNGSFSVTPRSVKIEITNHGYLKSIECSGAPAPTEESRSSIENYFRDGGIEIKFPGSVVRM
jgi:hypothetical protein